MTTRNDTETNLTAGATDVGREMVRTAGMLCRDPKFAVWVSMRRKMSQTLGDGLSEEAIAAWLRGFLIVDSRAELATNEGAQDRLALLLADYRKDTQDAPAD